MYKKSLTSCKLSLYTKKGVSALSDLLFAVLPLPMLWNVKLARRMKMEALGLLGFGFLEVNTLPWTQRLANISITVLSLLLSLKWPICRTTANTEISYLTALTSQFGK